VDTNLLLIDIYNCEIYGDFDTGTGYASDNGWEKLGNATLALRAIPIRSGKQLAFRCTMLFEHVVLYSHIE
jgi:hypothetical protein